MQLSSVLLLVDDFAASFRFYRDVMGFQVQFGDEKGPFASFAPGGDAVSISLFPRAYHASMIAAESAEKAADDRFTLFIRTQNVDQAFQSLLDKGARPLIKPTNRPDWGARTAHLRDSSGVLITVTQGL
jgi:catechol 2,3-dioxygenase-like lactoylglutathione lyase family enzyme